MQTDMVQVTKVNGTKDKRRTRTAASIKKQIATAARNRREALKAGKSYGHSKPKGNKLNRRPSSYKARPASAKGVAIGDAVVYVRHARDRAARLGEEGYAVLGLLSLALEALGAE